MDIKNVTTEDISAMSTEEKREFVRALINSEAAEVTAAVFDASTNRTLKLTDLVEAIGEEAAIDAIVSAFENGKSKAIGISGDEIQELAAKAAKGECTEEELKLLSFIEDQIGVSDQITFQQHYFADVLDLIHFAQNEVEYPVGLNDVLAPAVILSMVNFMKSKESSLHQYDGDPGTLATMMDQVGKDILNTWKATCTTVPSTDLIICSLLQLAVNLANDLDIKLVNAEILGEELGMKIQPIETEDDEEADENDNGSNTAKVIQPIVHDTADKNQEMRNLLKD